MSEKILEVKNANKYYGKLHVLKDINLSIKQGEVWAIIGPSGSGKSTLLYCISALETIKSGSIYFKNRNISEYNLRQIHELIGIVFQSYNLFPHLNVLDNIILAPNKVKGIKKKICKERALELLKKVGLEDKKNAFPHELSGGQAQRIAIARSLAMEPEIMLYDEVTSALDPELVHGVLDVISELVDEGMTSLLVTHEIPFAKESADYIVFMADGKCIEWGPAKELLANPQNERTIEFLEKVL
jgi:arginine/lysine/histidine transport system ATP-binding protein